MKKTLLIAVLVLACSRACADVAGYERRWSGQLDSGSCGFVPERIVPGNFMVLPGEELLIVDADGYARILIWTNAGLSTAWVSEGPVSAAARKSVFPIKRAGNKTDVFAFLEVNGRLSLVGSESEKFVALCEDCMPEGTEMFNALAAGACDMDGDGTDEVAVWAEKNGFYTVVALKLSGKTFSVFTVKDVDMEGGGDTLGFFPVCGKGGTEFYLWRNSGLDEYEMVHLSADEEGISSRQTISLAKLGITAGVVEPATSKGVIPEFFAMTAFGEKPVLTLFHPDGKAKSENYSVGLGTNLFSAADLNGDGSDEIITADYDCGFQVHGVSKPMAKVNGVAVDWKANIRQLTGGRILVSAGILKNVSVKTDKGFTVLTYGKRKLIIDHGTGAVVNSVPGYEENPQVALSYIKEPKRLFVDPIAAAEYLNFETRWDYLASRLDINTGEKR